MTKEQLLKRLRDLKKNKFILKDATKEERLMLMELEEKRELRCDFDLFSDNITITMLMKEMYEKKGVLTTEEKAKIEKVVEKAWNGKKWSGLSRYQGLSSTVLDVEGLKKFIEMIESGVSKSAISSMLGLGLDTISHMTKRLESLKKTSENN